MMIVTTEREEQRVRHLVLGQPRPRPAKTARRKRNKAPVVLAPGVEPWVALREDWSHKANGTPETHAHVDREARREGSLARLHKSGAIDAHQLAAADEIRAAYRLIVADVAVRTAKLEPRSTGGPNAASAEPIGRVIAERSYSAWRAAEPHAGMLLAIIIDDLPLTAAARDWRMSNRRARSVLIAGLDRWRRR